MVVDDRQAGAKSDDRILAVIAAFFEDRFDEPPPGARSAAASLIEALVSDGAKLIDNGGIIPVTKSPQHIAQAGRDGPATITPAMAWAGADALEFWKGAASQLELAEAAYIAMERCRIDQTVGELEPQLPSEGRSDS